MWVSNHVKILSRVKLLLTTFQVINLLLDSCPGHISVRTSFVCGSLRLVLGVLSSSISTISTIRFPIFSFQVENEELESKITILTKELSVLKDLFMEHAKGFCNGSNISLLSAEQLEALLGCQVNLDEHSKACSRNLPPSIEPLIDAAESELKSLKENEENQRCYAAKNNSNEVNCSVTTVVTENPISVKEENL